MTAALLDGLQECGAVVLYGPDTLHERGGTVAFNVRRGGRVVPHEEVEQAARDAGVAIRGGCFCNPGAAAAALALEPGRTRACLRGAFNPARFRRCMRDAAVGALRASVGLATTRGDLDRLAGVIERISRIV